MIIEKSIIRQAAEATGIGEEDLAVFFGKGHPRSYQPGEWLFQEATPRRWAGIILEGEVDVRRDSRLLASLKTGDFLGEIALVADVPGDPLDLIRLVLPRTQGVLAHAPEREDPVGEILLGDTSVHHLLQ